MSSSGLIVPGRFAKFEVSPTGVEGTFLNFAGLKSVGINASTSELNCSSFDSNGLSEFIPDMSEATFALDAHWADGDPGQRLVMIYEQTKQRFTLRFYMDLDPGSGKFYWEGLGFPTTGDKTGAMEDTGNLSYSIRGSGVQLKTQ